MDLAKQNELFLLKFMSILLLAGSPFAFLGIAVFDADFSDKWAWLFPIVYFSGMLFLIFFFVLRQKYEKPEKYAKNISALKETPKVIAILLLSILGLGAAIGIIWWIFSTISPLIILLIVIVFLLGYIAVRLS